MRVRRCWVVICTLFAAGAALAQAQSNIEIRVVAQQEVVVDTDAGYKDYRLIPATSVRPGEEVAYTIFFRNVSDLPATQIVIDDPIPAQVYLKTGSVFGAGTSISYSVDGGKTFDQPAALAVLDQGTPREARADEYTHIRWVFGDTLKPGEERIVGFRAILR